MNKKEYLKLLDKKISVLPDEERKEALDFYRELIEESPNEAEAIAKLPQPKQLASKLILEFGTKAPKGVKLPILTIIFAILSAPLTVPIVITIALLILSLLLLLGAIVLVFALASFACLAVGGVSLFAVVAAFGHDVGTGMIMLGVGLLALSACYLVARFTLFLSKKVFAGIRVFILKTVTRRYKNEA